MRARTNAASSAQCFSRPRLSAATAAASLEYLSDVSWNLGIVCVSADASKSERRRTNSPNAAAAARSCAGVCARCSETVFSIKSYMRQRSSARYGDPSLVGTMPSVSAPRALRCEVTAIILRINPSRLGKTSVLTRCKIYRRLSVVTRYVAFMCPSP